VEASQGGGLTDKPDVVETVTLTCS